MKTHATADILPLTAPTGGVHTAVHFVLDRFLLLPLGAAIALIWANTFGESYFRFAHAAAYPINEIGMALVLGLVAQEAFEGIMPGGALHSWRRTALPVVAAAGAVIGAAGTYWLYVNLKHELALAPAWPAATAVDVVAAYYVARMIWRSRRVHAFVLILTLAIDAFGLLLLPVPQPAVAFGTVAPLAMLAALSLAAALRLSRIPTYAVYLLPGALSWLALYAAGLHPALALLPIVPFLPRQPRTETVFGEDFDQPRPEDNGLQAFENHWHVAAQVIVFLFGLANAGVLLRGYDTGTWAMLVASVAGRPLGFLAAVAVGIGFGLHLPPRVGWRELIVIGLTTSAGFTFPLLFATDLLAMGPLLSQIKLGALVSAGAAFLALGLARALRIGRWAPRSR